MPSPDPEPSPPPVPVPPRAGIGRLGRWVGALLAIVLLLAVVAFAWWLLHRPPASDAASGGAPSGGPGGGPPGTAGPPGAGGPGGRRSPPSTVAVASARTADVPVMVEALGTVSPLATATVRAQVSGVLLQVLYREGQTVKKGQTLAVIDPEPFRIAVMQAEGARVRDDAQLTNARLTLERYRTLLQQDSIARQDVDTQAALVRQLEGTVATDRAAEAQARLDLSYTRIAAPVDGRVGLRTVDVGNYVTAGEATGVAVITQFSPIDVEFALPQDQVPEVQSRIAQGARLPVDAFDRTRTTVLDHGAFSALDNQIDTTTGTVKAKARFANAAFTLFPNQFVNVQLQLRTIAGAIVVPVTAVRHGAGGDYVYVLKDDRTVALRNVKRGTSTVDTVVVSSGLAAGERVVTEGADRLKDGAPVQLASERAATAASGASDAASGGRRGGRRRDREAAASAP